MNSNKRIWQALFAVFICSFSVLLYLGSEIYQQAPPIPNNIQTPEGKVIFTKEDIEQGQMVWRSMGGHQNGSIWGHGSLLAPDWNADWLHREALASLEQLAKREYGKSYQALTKPEQKYLQAQLQET